MKQMILIATLLCLSNSTFASGGHFHPKKVAKCGSSSCTEEQIKNAVPSAIKELVNWKQADPKWESAKIESLIKKEFKKGAKTLNAWVVTLVDEKESDTAKNKRFVFITDDGFVFKTNTTGELK